MMWIFLLACQAEQTEALKIDARPRVQLSQSLPPNQPLTQSYSSTLEAQADVVEDADPEDFDPEIEEITDES